VHDIAMRQAVIFQLSLENILSLTRPYKRASAS
jgi:hypothetical protein